MDIRVEDLRFGYDDDPVLDGISLDIDEPELVCIIGPNGVGKSTLVKCLDKIITPDSGNIYYDGNELHGIPLKELAKMVGFVPVSNDDSFSLNVLETVLQGRHPHQKMSSRDEDVKISFDALQTVGMESFCMRSTSELSAGQKQKIAIAKGLAQKPKMLILDEPTSNLDVRHQILITKMLRNLSHDKGIVIVMISHDLNIASKFADTIIVMCEPGVIKCIGKPEEVITEQNISEVYGVQCRIIDDDGRPHVILKDAI